MTKFLPNSDSKDEKSGRLCSPTSRDGKGSLPAPTILRAPPTIGGSEPGLPVADKSDGFFRILRSQPSGPLADKWREFLADSDYPTHYTAREFFLEPASRSKNPFAVLSTADDRVTGVLTGIN